MKQYSKKTIASILLVLLTSLVCAFLVTGKFYISAGIAGIALLIEAWYLLRQMERSDRLFRQFVWSVRYSDFLASGKTPRENSEALPRELTEAMEEALLYYKKHLQQKESQLQYFQALANHIDLSVFVYSSETAQIEWMNQAAKIQTGLNFAETIDDLAAYHPELPARLRILHPGELSILQVRRQEDYSQLILSSMSFVVLNKPLTVVSMKNIRSVLENKETEAWQKLIRVLTHEIMNSMTPIVSLSELLKNKQASEEISEEDREEMNQAINTIFRRSSGLVRFVENYRKVTGIPTPVPEIIPVDSLLNSVVLLFREETDTIRILPSSSHLQVIADKTLIEQILINLIKNALDATMDCPAPLIELSAGINAEGKTFIQVKDNGTGIPADVQERIFIPFFTTKPVGSGIGLSVSRQIMYMHKGSLTVISEAGKGSRFLLTFA